jgi:hypothetical protein
MIFHPSRRTLQRFAERELAPAGQRRVASHVVSCERCRTYVSFARSLGEALGDYQSANEPAVADEKLIERVLAERAAGARVILPVGEQGQAAKHWRGRVVSGIVVSVAAAMVLLLMRSWRAPERPVPNGSVAQQPKAVGNDSLGSAATDSFPAHDFVSTLFLPQEAHAAQPPRGTGPLLPSATLSGAELEPGHFVFAQLSIDSTGRSREVARGTIDLAAAEIEGTVGWRFISAWRFSDRVEVETLYVDRGSLRLLGRTLHVAPYLHYREITIRQRLMGDSLVGWMNTYEGLGRPIARRLSPAFGPYITDAIASFALSGVDLDARWRRSLSVVGWAVRPNDVAYPIELRVAGDERVTVPGGTFDCTRLTITVNGSRQSYWVRKEDGIGVRTLTEPSPRTATRKSVVLLSATP